MRRHALGIIALLLLAAAGVLAIVHPTEGMWLGALLRVGGLLGAVWLAYPHLQRVPWWLMLVLLLVGVALLILFRQPRMLLLLLVVGIVWYRLRPYLKA
jgi:hypothetical protein